MFDVFNRGWDQTGSNGANLSFWKALDIAGTNGIDPVCIFEDLAAEKLILSRLCILKHPLTGNSGSWA